MPVVMPSVLITNINHICNKFDELSVVASKLNPDIIALTETWLTPDVPDSHCSLLDYNILRRDRIGKIGGGVMIYIRSSIFYRNLDILNEGNFEILWVWLRPQFLPRPVSALIVGVVYCPPWYNFCPPECPPNPNFGGRPHKNSGLQPKARALRHR